MNKTHFTTIPYPMTNTCQLTFAPSTRGTAVALAVRAARSCTISHCHLYIYTNILVYIYIYVWNPPTKHDRSTLRNFKHINYQYTWIFFKLRHSSLNSHNRPFLREEPCCIVKNGPREPVNVRHTL